MEVLKNTQHKLKNKKKVIFTKLSKNTFKLESIVENKNIFLEKLLNFDLIHLFYKVNIQYFESVDFKLINENEAILFILMKPLIKQLGTPARYVNLKITKKEEGDKCVLFNARACNDFNNKTSTSAVPSPLLNIDIICNIINPHLLHIYEVLTFDETYASYSIFEQIVSPILKIIFKQTIQAVEEINNK
jgi:hypothetical protein